MLLNEHLSKVLFAEAGLPVPPGLALEREDLGAAAPNFPLPWFVKAQVLAGGRGKAGGVLRVDRAEDLPAVAAKVLDLSIKGDAVPFVRVEPGADVRREVYLSLAVSRPRRRILLTVGRQGGVEIENQGRDNLLVQEIDLPGGLCGHQVRAAFFHLGLDRELFAPFAELVGGLFAAMTARGLLLAEINPLVLTGEGAFLVLDGKVEVDDNFADLTPDMARFFEPRHYCREENAARAAGLALVKLGGWVGLMVNGAGLAMATMDLLNFSGLPAANFLDLGGGADQKRMETALSLLFGDRQVRAVFINLFGGILSCEKVARAMAAALGGRAPAKPLVVRMAGNGAEEGLRILKDLNQPDVHLVSHMGAGLKILESFRPANAPALVFPSADVPSGGQAPAGSGVGRRPLPFGRDTRILVQGVTGKEGGLHTELMLAYGAKVTAGVTPFKGGRKIHGVPVYDSVGLALKNHRIDASIIFVPPRMAADAILEAVAHEVPYVVCITEGIPQQDMLAVLARMRGSNTRLIGPNTPGLIVPGRTKIGILPTTPFAPGPVAVVSRSGTLTYEAAARLTAAGVGQSLGLGVGGDPFTGLSFIDAAEMLRDHDETRALLVLGEIGGRAEEDLAEYVVATRFPKPVLAFIAGRTAPPGRRLGHAGAILESGGGIEAKLEAMRGAGFRVCPTLASIPEAAAQILRAGRGA